ncbi:DUF1062 domain-containing protein [Chryseobacterium sp.]|uniref:DUF1062 domain-containing protein n=1 Tax=Chryseobacterium sp. TaxID=1871047 RepID=UPI0025BCCF4C|nr:DUF1062 domain-containing protein [Chryseobacterium sp.]
MNSQKRNIDVWLIYRCIQCDSTYNITILSRTRPELINKGQFSQFSENNPEIAWEYAFSPEIRIKNNMEPDFNSVEYCIENENITIDGLLNMEREVIMIKIKCPFEFGLKLSSVIRQCLGLSISQLNQLTEAEVFSIPPNKSIKKYKVKNGDILQVDTRKLKSIYLNK